MRNLAGRDEDNRIDARFMVDACQGSIGCGFAGCFFAPATAAAAGGVLHVMGALVIGTVALTSIAVILSVPLLTGITKGLRSENHALAANVLEVTVAFGCLLLAATIGAAALGVAPYPVLVCTMVGVLAATVGVLGVSFLLWLTGYTAAALRNDLLLIQP